MFRKKKSHGVDRNHPDDPAKAKDRYSWDDERNKCQNETIKLNDGARTLEEQQVFIREKSASEDNENKKISGSYLVLVFVVFLF